jgi:hypothetical protein
MELPQMIQVAYQKAMENGGSEALAVARDIIQEMSKQRDYEARDRFNSSLLRIQQELKPILKRGKGEKPGHKYALIEDIDAELNPLLSREGMSLSFEPAVSEKPNVIVVSAVLAQGAYERRYPLEMPADGAGPKGGSVMTRTHATGSAMTYAKRYLKNFIFDIQFKQKDDDGNRAGGKAANSMDEWAVDEYLNAIGSASTMDELKSVYFDGYKKADAIGDGASKNKFIAAKNNRQGELVK